MQVHPFEISCPKCGAPKGKACHGVYVSDTRDRDNWPHSFHLERLDKAEEIEEKESLAFDSLDLDTLLDLEDQELTSAQMEEDESRLAETALQQLREMIETAEVDPNTGEIVLDARTPSGVQVIERLGSLTELHEFLKGFGYEESENDLSQLSFGYGGAIDLGEQEINKTIAYAQELELFPKTELAETTLFKVDSSLLIPQVRIELGSVNEEIIRFLAAHPERLRTLEPRHFEELVAEIFRDFGYDVILTPKSKDGGLDIRAIRKDSVGTLLYLIECKRYKPTRPVGVEIVRGLYGVAALERATHGVIATTSHFTKGAKEFADKVRYQMSLRDFDDLVGWLKKYPTSKRRGH